RGGRPRRRAAGQPQPVRQPSDAALDAVGNARRHGPAARRRLSLWRPTGRGGAADSRGGSVAHHRLLAFAAGPHPAGGRAVGAARNRLGRRRRRTMTLLAIRGLTKRFGGLVATDALDLDVNEGEIHAIIGPNGAGKTTLIGQLAGSLAPDAGTVRMAGHDVTRLSAHARVRHGMARSFQVTNLFRDFTALDNAALAAQATDGSSFRFWRAVPDAEPLFVRGREWLAMVGLAGRAETLAGTLAHGEQRQLEVALALATRPKLLLLDEPMAGLGPERAPR